MDLGARGLGMTRAPPPLSGSGRNPVSVASPAQIRRPAGAPYAPRGGTIGEFFFLLFSACRIPSGLNSC
jgi:hypothetical protein